jgi:hypothetical protein
MKTIFPELTPIRRPISEEVLNAAQPATAEVIITDWPTGRSPGVLQGTFPMGIINSPNSLTTIQMVICEHGFPNQPIVKSLVGICTDFSQAQKLVETDYLEVLTEENYSVITDRLMVTSVSDSTNPTPITTYEISDKSYKWSICTVSTNTLINASL